MDFSERGSTKGRGDEGADHLHVCGIASVIKSQPHLGWMNSSTTHLVGSNRPTTRLILGPHAFLLREISGDRHDELAAGLLHVLVFEGGRLHSSGAPGNKNTSQQE